MSTLERAIAIAAEAHAGAVDKGGAPYILHPLRVMLAMTGEDARIAAVLHDVVEDSAWTLDALRTDGFSETVVTAVAAVTKREGEDYLDFVRRAKRHPVAAEVKLGDLADNSDLSRLPDPTPRDYDRLAKYRAAMAILRGDPEGGSA